VTADYAGVRVVVLGASGFIGRWVARKLAEAGAETALVVRDRTIVSDLRGRIFEVDLARDNGVESVFKAFRPAIIFNLAGYGVDQTERDEALSERLNADLPREICEAAAIWKDPSWLGQHIVHVGSALEYGVVGGDLREDGPTQPTTLYGRSKLRGTQQVIESCAKLGMRGLTARLFTVYGPGEHDTRLLPSLIRAAKSGQRLDLTEGAQLRDFTYVEDVAKGLLRLGVARAEQGLVVNLATGCLSSVRSFVEIAAHELGIPSPQLGFGRLPTRAEEMRHNPVSVSRLREMISFVPSASIEAGVRRTLTWNNLSPAELTK
jgi:nucleoside-diphosphate-sugar epimerase